MKFAFVALVGCAQGILLKQKDDGLDSDFGEFFGANSQPEFLVEAKKYNNMTGPTCKKGDTATVHYTGKLPNGKVFDSSLEPAIAPEPIQFVIGNKQVIPCWE